eukprot:1150729-Amphidinium_carterae.1
MEPLLKDWLGPSRGDDVSPVERSPLFAAEGFVGDWLRCTRPKSATTPGIVATTRVGDDGPEAVAGRMILSDVMARQTALAD